MTLKNLNERKAPIVHINKALGKYRNEPAFAKKLAKANEMLRDGQLPKHLLPG